MANCGCQGGCSCFFTGDPGGSTSITGLGTLEDPFIIIANDPAYIHPAAKLKRAISDQNISNNTLTAVIYDTEEFDNDNMVNIAGNPTRLTITTAGLYVIGSNTLFNGGLANNVIVSIRKNGILTEIEEEQTLGMSSVGLTPTVLSSCVAGDYFEVMVFQNSGGIAVINRFATDLWGVRVGASS